MDRRAALSARAAAAAAWAGAALLLLWVISVAGATGWGLPVNWALLLAGIALLALRALA
ncbi:MAG TPA: hypothetical protein VFA19_13480 [Gaiellaceae bacterium]|nr:hypothetical protein [Gaiellaceae bacterium]